MKDILLSQHDGVLTITINRPEKKNAITREMYAAMADAFEKAASDNDVKVIVIKGEGDSFTAGNDITMFANASEETTQDTVRFMKALAGASVPVVAQVHGAVVGIGTTLLLHCDFVYCADSTYFSLPFINLALVPEYGSSLLLPKLVGHKKAAEWLMLGDAFDANEALSAGIVNKVCTIDELEQTTQKTVSKLLSKPKYALGQTKALMKSEQDEMMAHLHTELKVFGEQLASAPAKEAFDAFLNKRKPDFTQFD